jgi:hypothetical protein
MSPLTKKLLLVAAGAAVGALAAVPELAAYGDMLKALAGFLMGAGAVKRPGDTAA